MKTKVQDLISVTLCHVLIAQCTIVARLRGINWGSCRTNRYCRSIRPTNLKI